MARSSTYQEGGFIREWIRDCLFGYIADHLDGMDDYFKECWRDVKDERGGIRYRTSAFSKTSLNIRKFTVHILLKPGLENFEHYFTSM